MKGNVLIKVALALITFFLTVIALTAFLAAGRAQGNPGGKFDHVQGLGGSGRATRSPGGSGAGERGTARSQNHWGETWMRLGYGQHGR